MIRALHFTGATRKTREISAEDLPTLYTELPAEDSLWIDLAAATTEEEARVLTQFLGVHPLTLEDVTKPRREPLQGAHLPKVEEFEHYLFVVINPLPLDMRPEAVASDGAKVSRRKRLRLRPQLSAALTPQVLVTHHYDGLPCVDSVWQHTLRHHDAARHGPDYVFHLILDAVVDEYAPVVDAVADRLDHLESRMFRRPAPTVLKQLLRMKRGITMLRKTLILEREVLARLIRGEFASIDATEAVYYRNVYDHLVRYAELTDSSREMVSDLMQLHLSAVSNRLNEIVKVLTMISTIILPMTLIAGIYGMNFDNMPEKSWTYGYPMSLGLMALTLVGGVWYFRRKGWI
jgi:magnesium transporter